MNNLFIWVSRHPLTTDQKDLILDTFFEGKTNIIEYGDINVFKDEDLDQLYKLASNTNDFVVIGGVHGLLGAFALQNGFSFGAFNNINRAPIGEKPDFHTTELKVVYPQ